MRRTSVALSVLFASAQARAGGGAATDAYDGVRPEPAVDVHALLDAYWQVSLLAPGRRAPQYRAFDDAEGAPSLGLARLTLAHAPETLGFRLDVGAGDLAGGFYALDPASASHPTVSRALSFVEQAFATAVLPVGGGLAIDVGKFGTPVGLEDNESPTNWSYSRGLLFTLAEPTYHTGGRVTARAGAVDVSAFWVNGWNTNILGGNGMRTAGAAVTWNPSDALQVAGVYLGGLERAPTRLTDPTLSFRNEVDGYVRWAMSDAVAAAWTADVGRDSARGGATWWGLGGSLRWQALPWLAGVVRGERYDDLDGFTSGAPQRLVEGTLTLEARQDVAPFTLLTRLEYRRDQSDEQVFVTGSPQVATHQDTLTLALLAAF